MFDILFLGTGASTPSRDYALPAVMVRHGQDMVLLDCGEGTQRQIMVSPLSFMKISAIFVTHLHGDHFYGLPGLVQTMGMMGRKDPLVIRGPPGTAEAVDAILKICPGEIGFDLDVVDMAPGEQVPVGKLLVSSFATVHGVDSQGYLIKAPDVRGKIDADKARSLGISGKDFATLEAGGEVNGVRLSDICAPDKKGKVLAYTGDTRPCDSVREAVKGADVLIHEATYLKSQAEHAEEFFHSTAADAATIARDCGCRHLFLIHISNRYKDRGECLKEAAEIFPRTHVPNDLSMYRITAGGGVRSV